MVSDRQLQANRRNALKSTGPRTPEGKAVVAQNAVTHGLLAQLEVLPGLERQEDWDNHTSEVMADLAPEGRMEVILAERVALLTWRLGRTARYEREVAAIALENAERDLAREDLDWGREQSQAESPLGKARGLMACSQALLDVLADLPKSAEQTPLDEAYVYLIMEVAAKVAAMTSLHLIDPSCAALRERGHKAKTAGQVRQWLQEAAKFRNMTAESLFEGVVEQVYRDLDKAKKEHSRLIRVLNQYQRSRLLPTDGESQKIQRYESHLERSLYKALHELQRLQAARRGLPVPPPIVVDVDVSGQPQSA